MKLQTVLPLLLIFLFQYQLLFAADNKSTNSEDKAILLGQQIYRQGVLPSGEPVQALVMGDIPFDGRMFTCSNCHQRSGLGSREGTVITWPVNGRELAAPRKRTGAFRQSSDSGAMKGSHGKLPEYFQVPDVRPPYNDETLARVIRTGVDSAGNRLNNVMPRYQLDDAAMALLINYLRHLSTIVSPGVDDTTLQFATVIGGDVTEEEKSAMLSVLQAHIDAHNAQTRNEEKRAAAGPFFHSEKNQAYRRLTLHIWQLHGPDDTWRKQLEQYYQQQPVFALLGGIARGSWAPIHTFSEDNKIPCIFPVTDLPVLSDSDWYTLYFTRGKYQEGDSAARYLKKNIADPQAVEIVQVYGEGDMHGATLARGFATTWQKLGGTTVRDLVLKGDDTFPSQILDEIFTASSSVVLLIWLSDEYKQAYHFLTTQYIDRTVLTIGSLTLLQENIAFVPDTAREKMVFTYPFSTRQDDAASRMVVERWLKTHSIPLIDINIQAKMYFLGWMLPGALKSMRSEYFRDYFMERFDMMPDQNYAIAIYPRLSFGPGQRYAAKRGCYIVKITNGEHPKVVPLSDWMIY